MLVWGRAFLTIMLIIMTIFVNVLLAMGITVKQLLKFDLRLIKVCTLAGAGMGLSKAVSRRIYLPNQPFE